MKKWILIILLSLILLTVGCFVLGYHTYAYGIGFFTGSFALSAGYVVSMKSQTYVHKSYHEDYVNRLKRK